MTQYLTFCLFSSIAIVGLYLTASDGGLLNFLKMPFEWVQIEISEAEDNMRPVPKWIQFVDFIGNPIIMCPLCMASIWGTVMYCIWFENFDVREWICCCFAIACMNTFIIHVYNKIK